MLQRNLRISFLSRVVLLNSISKFYDEKSGRCACKKKRRLNIFAKIQFCMRNSTKVLTLSLFSFLFFHGKINAQATCATAVMLNTGPTCSPTSGTLLGANATTLAATCSANPNTTADVWYRFVAQSTFPTITLSNVGSNFSAAGPRIQILSGTCGTQTVRACSNTLSATPSTALTLGTTYYVRILTNTNTGIPVSGNWGFDICVVNPSVVASRMNELFKETTLYGTVDDVLGSPYPAGNLNNPWEITYGSDGYLWVTEGKGYTIRRIDPNSGVATTMVDLSNTATGWLTLAEHTTFNRVFASTQSPWPQGGMMGLAVHPQFKDSANKKFIYVGYVHSANGGSSGPGYLFTTKIVRFEYDTVNNKLYRPVSLCDTIRGSDDHNSGRMIIAPVDGVNYLFYAVGDMGTGNYNNKTRTNKSQNSGSYEGKILRFNLEPDSDVGLFDRWIPDSTGNHNNPFNGAAQNAVYTTGIRNNQGFAYNPITNRLYGSEHGMFADDEINIIERGKNNGHPLVEGYKDGNYDGAKPGSSSGTSYSVIVSEVANAAAIGADYKDPVYSFYPAPKGAAGVPNTILGIYNSTTGDPASNANTSIAQSGLDVYYSAFIPGWKNSLLTASMKKAKFFRLKLNSAGDTVVSTPPGSASPLNDTVGLFWSLNRYRDLAISPDGRTIFASIDRDQTTSGPTSGSPQPSLCPGCIKKFEFLGYADNAGVSTIPTSIPVGTGVPDIVTAVTKTVINSDNNNIWVPVTDNNGDIIAEIDANGINLDTITTSVYINTAAIRTTSTGKLYLDRSVTINPKNPIPIGQNVNVRFYLKASELTALINAPGSTVTGIGDINIFKNDDANSAVLTSPTTLVTPTTRANFSSDFVVTANITSFSSFYFGADLSTLPLDLLSFTGHLQSNNTVLLNWKTENEINTSHFVVERSIDGSRYIAIGNVPSQGGRTNTGLSFNYSSIDNDAINQSTQKLYYRLKMVDIDGTYKYSNIVTITLPFITGRLTVSPNPVLNEVKVTLASPKEGRAQWKLMDNTGRVLIKGSANVRKGVNNNFNINMSRLPAGTYYLNVNGAGNDHRVKLQKL